MLNIALIKSLPASNPVRPWHQFLALFPLLDTSTFIFEREGKTEEALTRNRENNSFSYIQQGSVQPGSMSDPWASHKSEIIGSQWRDVNIHHNGMGAETERYISCSMYSDWKMMSQTSTGCTLIGFCYLESYLNPKLSAANWNAHLWL